MGAHQRQRKLVGEQLVIGEAAARRMAGVKRGFVGRRMRAVKCAVPVGPSLLLEEPGVEPFAEIGRTRQRLADRLGERFVGQALGQRIDRLDGLDAGDVGERRDMVRMRHLDMAAEMLDASRYHPGFPLG